MDGLAAAIYRMLPVATGDAGPLAYLSSVGGVARASPFADIRPIPPPSLMESVFTDLIRFNRF